MSRGFNIDQVGKVARCARQSGREGRGQVYVMKEGGFSALPYAQRLHSHVDIIRPGAW